METEFYNFIVVKRWFYTPLKFIKNLPEIWMNRRGSNVIAPLDPRGFPMRLCRKEVYGREFLSPADPRGFSSCLCQKEVYGGEYRCFEDLNQRISTNNSGSNFNGV